MKGRIDGTGRLVIERGDNEVLQQCPFSDHRSCGDWCPAFREPEAEIRYSYDIGCPPEPTGRTILRLCSQVGTLTFDEFEDGRQA
jgi:hypothetical protein